MKSKLDASRQARTETTIVTCPDCGAKIPLRGVIRIGQRVLCPSCEADLEMTDTHPAELDWVNDDLVDQDARW